MVKRLKSFLAGQPQLHGSLFLSLGSDENDKMRAAFLEAVQVLDTHAPDGLRWLARSTNGASHGTNAQMATPIALRWLFDAQWAPAADAAP